MTQFRQGDVMLRAIDGRPSGTTTVATKTARVVVAEGEKTGHAHAVVGDDVAVFERDGTLYIEVGDGARLEHEEHDTLALPPGMYEVVCQREYNPGPSKSLRAITD